jgi:hypothetical protein
MAAGIPKTVAPATVDVARASLIDVETTAP